MARVVHFEVHADDPERAVPFYPATLDWQFTKWEGPMDYWLIQTGPQEELGIDGGLVRRQGPGNGQAITAYVCTVGVTDLDATLEKVMTNGGALAMPKMPVPGVG